MSLMNLLGELCGLLFRIHGSAAILDDGIAIALASRKGNPLR